MAFAARPWIALALALVVALGGGAWAIVAASSGDDDDRAAQATAAAEVLQFHSRPGLDPDKVTVAVPAHRTAPGLVFLAVKRGPGQDGPMIVDDEGRVRWFRKAPGRTTATGFRVQRYRGQPVLTWWQGRTMLGHGEGEYVILDRHYEEVARVRAGNGQMGDHHEIQLTPRGTAYIAVYALRKLDLRSVGGKRDGRIFDSMIQEIDIESGRVLWEWSAADHFPVSEGATPPKATKPHDYFHINAVDEDRDGNLLVSARNMHGIYKISRRTGKVIWRLGGERSDFAMGPGARFAFQHDIVRRADGTLSLFDNEATPPQAEQSRGLVLRLDRRARTATVVREYTHPDGLLSIAEGSMQTLPNGNVFIGWGPEPHISEFSRDGRLLFDLTIPEGSDSYQAFRHEWVGEPRDRPALAAKRTRDDGFVVWASWNGATEVQRWLVLAGDDEDDLMPVATAPWRDFETEIRVRNGARYVAVQALDADGRALGTSRTIEPVGS